MSTIPTPEADSFYSGPCKQPLNARQREHARNLERRLTVAMTALQYCHDYAKPDLIIRDDVTGPAFAEIQRIKDGRPVLTSAPPVQ